MKPSCSEYTLIYFSCYLSTHEQVFLMMTTLLSRATVLRLAAKRFNYTIAPICYQPRTEFKGSKSSSDYLNFPVNREFHMTSTTRIAPFLVAAAAAGVIVGGSYALKAVQRVQKELHAGDTDNSKTRNIDPREFPEGGFDERMGVAEAAKILGISVTSGRRTVIEAHRRLLLMNHPDVGGSNFIAAKINEAKYVLLGE